MASYWSNKKCLHNKMISTREVADTSFTKKWHMKCLACHTTRPLHEFGPAHYQMQQLAALLKHMTKQRRVSLVRSEQKASQQNECAAVKMEECSHAVRRKANYIGDSSCYHVQAVEQASCIHNNPSYPFKQSQHEQPNGPCDGQWRKLPTDYILNIQINIWFTNLAHQGDAISFKASARQFGGQLLKVAGYV